MAEDILSKYAVEAEGDPLAKYAVAAPEAKPQDEGITINQQHPALSTKDRVLVKNFAAGPQGSANYLGQLGFEVGQDPGGLKIRRPGEQYWFRVEKEGLEFADALDIGTDITSGIATGAGAVAGGGATFGAGSVAGAAGGAAAHEAGRQAVGAMLGMGPESLGEAAKDVALEGAVGGAAELVLGGAGKVVRGRLGRKKTADLAASQDRMAKLPKPAQVADDVAPAPKIEPLPETPPITPDLEPGAAAVPPPEPGLREPGFDGFKKITDARITKARYNNTVVEPSKKGVPVLKPGKPLTPEDATRKWHEKNEFFKQANPGEELPNFTTNVPPMPRKYRFQQSEPQRAKQISRMHDDSLRTWMHNAGHTDAWAEEMSRPQMQSWIAKHSHEFDDAVIRHRASVYRTMNDMARKGEVGEYAFYERDGTMRVMVAAMNAPATAKAIPEKVVREFAEGADEVALRGLAKRLRTKGGKKKGKKKRKKIDRMDKDQLVTEITNSQRTNFTTGLTYDPAKFGNRVVWEMKYPTGGHGDWKTIPTDSLVSMRGPGRDTINFLETTAAPTGVRGAVSRGIHKLGRGVEYVPNKIMEATGAAKVLKKPLGMVGAGAGVVAAPGVVGPALAFLGAGKAVHTLGSVFGRSGTSRALRATAPPRIKVILDRGAKLHKAGRTAAIYVLMKQHPEVEEWLSNQGEIE